MSTYDLLEIFRKSYQLEMNLEKRGYELVLCTESEAVGYMASGYEAILYMPKVEKQQVIDVATRNQVFTPKATRHKLPARPIGLNVPLSLLRNQEINLKEANTLLADHLRNKKVRRHDPGAKWMNSAYEEVLYIFSDF